jgi:integrase
MKVAKVRNHGKTRWRVNDHSGPGGKRQRKFFDTREAAERYDRQRTDDRNAYGIHFATIPASERAALGYHLQRIHALGWTLASAVDFIERHGKAPPSVLLGTVAAEFLAARQAAGIRPRYLRTLRASIERFLKNRRDKPMAEITPAEILEHITRNGWKPSTMRSYLVDVRTLFSFAVKRKYLRENPALAVDLPRMDEKPPGILTPDQARELLHVCLDVAPDILPAIALNPFGGLRRAEAEKNELAEISAEFVEVQAHKAKTRRRRLVPISPQLRNWLDCSRAVGGTLPAVNYADKFKSALDKAGLRADWPQNALRHSFASYHYAKHRNENDTAAIMGISPQMVFAHYRELVRPADADAFFSILPPPDAVARAQAARGRRRHDGV